jgi:hypothetical protein
MRAVIHRKTGNPYQYLGTGIDCTNERDGAVVVFYRSLADPTQLFAREQGEFWDRFEFAQAGAVCDASL